MALLARGNFFSGCGHRDTDSHRKTRGGKSFVFNVCDLFQQALTNISRQSHVCSSTIGLWSHPLMMAQSNCGMCVQVCGSYSSWRFALASSKYSAERNFDMYVCGRWVHPQSGGPGQWREWWGGVANSCQRDQIGLCCRQQEWNRGDKASSAGLWCGEQVSRKCTSAGSM